MFTTTISSQVSSSLALLSSSGLINDFYLAGGTGCALQLGHRKSVDLDFFSSSEFNPKLLASKLSDLGQFKLDQLAKGTVLANLETVKVSFFFYPYPLIFQKKHHLKVSIADFKDIGCMKLDAIASRGTKRDFVDLYFILQNQKLSDLLGWFETKYQGLNYNLAHIIKSLAYFTDAESEPMPKMLIDVSWQQIKKFLVSNTKEVAKSLFLSRKPRFLK